MTFDLDPNSVLGNPDSLYLFSGGLDSLCAVMEAAVQHGKRPLLLSHSPAFNIESRQRQLANILKDRFGDHWQFPLIRVPIHLTGSEASDYTQRTRPFLFASLGAVFAQCLGLREVCLADNGVVSLNLPINGQVIGARASRSTHPKFIRLFNHFIQEVFPTDAPTVANPFWDRTRAEGLAVLQAINAVDLVQETCSCSHPRYRTRMETHCGVCSQCIDRRFATLAADLEEYDPPENYKVDIFYQGLSPGTDQTMALSYTRFATEVEDLDDIGLFLRFSELSECLDPNDPHCNAVAERLVALLKRHASSVIGVIEEQIALANSELARESLPPNCLLRLIAGSVAPVAQTDDFRHSPDYREVWLGEERLSLTTNQARVVELLDQQRMEGIGALSQGYILETLDIGSQNLAQVFRGCPAWNRLIIRAEGRGMYRLNIPLP